MKSGDAAVNPGIAATESSVESREQRRSAEELAGWAAVVSAAVAQGRSAPRLGLCEDGAPVNWRQDLGASAASLDAGAAERRGREVPQTSASSAGGVEGESGLDCHLQLRVDGGDLGEVALVVERKADGLQLTVGAASDEAFARFSLEINAMRGALQAQGLEVSSLKLVRMDGLGTVPALGRPVGSPRLLGAEEAARRQRGPQKDPKRPRLNLRG